MTISAAVLDAMLAAGASAEVIAAAVKVDIAENEARLEARVARKRASNAERQRRYREAHNASNALQGVSNALSRVTPPPPSPPKDNNQTPLTPAPVLASLEPRAREDTAEFVEFWSTYPNKVGKPDARLKFQKALEKAELADILNGLRRYIRDKPADREWCNPATWLHQERWSDRPAFAATGHAKPNGTGPPRKLRGSAALSEIASKPLSETFGTIFDEPSVNPNGNFAARNGR